MVVTASSGGAEVIPVLKGGFVMIFAFLVMLMYAKVSNYLSPNRLFYIVLFPFLLFFLLYGWVLFPYGSYFELSNIANKLDAYFGPEHKHWVFVVRYWHSALFFIFAEIWGGMAIGVMFWGLANSVTTMNDARRFYALYTAGGHLGTLIAGMIGFCVTTYCSKWLSYQDSVRILMSLVFVLGMLVFAVFNWADKNVFHNKVSIKKEKISLSLYKSILLVFKSPQILFISLLVIGYGLSVNLVEVSWKAILKDYFVLPGEYQQFTSMLQIVLGLVSLFIAIGFSSGIIRKYGWYFSAQLTPMVLGVTSLLFFFAYFIFSDYKNNPIQLFGMSAIFWLVAIGALHNVLCKAMKYSMFDPTKEMAFISLDQELKTKGKAAVDLLGARFGKSGSSWVQILLIELVGAGSILGAVPLLIPCVAIAVAVWSVSVHALNKRMNRDYSTRNINKVKDIADNINFEHKIH